MPKSSTIDSSVIGNASNALTSFCTKHPLLALITTVALSVIAVIGIIYRQDAQNEQAVIECIKKGNLKDARTLTSKIYSTPKRDNAYEKLSLAYSRKHDVEKARLMAQRISSSELKKKALLQISIR